MPLRMISALDSNERAMNLEVLTTLNPSLGGEVGHPLVSLNELRTAVRISAVVEGVHSYEDVAAPENFGPSQRERQEDRVASWNVGNGNAVGHLINRTS